VTGLLNITRLDQWFDICPSVDDVGAKLASMR